MDVFKLIRNFRMSSIEKNLIVAVRKYLKGSRCYSEEKSCVGKHRLVPCKESDTVHICLDEPLHLGPEANMHVTCTNHKRVIVIGAGIAGLSAGARMHSSGLEDFIILEAKDRPGGRVDTRKLGNTVVDLGAEFIQGACISNPIYQLACINGLITDSSQRVEKRRGIFLTSDCRSVGAYSKVLVTLDQLFKNLVKEAQNECEMERNVFAHIETKMKKEVEKYKDWEKSDAMRTVYSIMNEKRAELGIDLAHISVKDFGTKIQLPGGNMRFDKGAIGVINSLLKQIPKEKVVCNKGVQTIWWCEGTEGIRVRCWDGTEYNACHVIITVSLGVLRNQHCLFCPPLPEDKVCAIRSIPFGRAGKLYLKYKDPFWLEQGLSMRYSWLKEELEDKQDWIKGIGSIEQLPSSTDYILRIIVGGREAQTMESCKESINDIIRWLDETIGSPLPLPVEAVKSSWNNDLFTGGSSSINYVRMQELLSSPIPNPETPLLLFAGEATVPGFAGSMHAASLSGVREADNLLKIIKVYTKPKEYEKEEVQPDSDEGYYNPECKISHQ